MAVLRGILLFVFFGGLVWLAVSHGMKEDGGGDVAHAAQAPAPEAAAAQTELRAPEDPDDFGDGTESGDFAGNVPEPGERTRRGAGRPIAAPRGGPVRHRRARGSGGNAAGGHRFRPFRRWRGGDPRVRRADERVGGRCGRRARRGRRTAGHGRRGPRTAGGAGVVGRGAGRAGRRRRRGARFLGRSGRLGPARARASVVGRRTRTRAARARSLALGGPRQPRARRRRQRRSPAPQRGAEPGSDQRRRAQPRVRVLDGGER